MFKRGFRGCFYTRSRLRVKVPERGMVSLAAQRREGRIGFYFEFSLRRYERSLGKDKSPNSF